VSSPSSPAAPARRHPNRATASLDASQIERTWYVVDAADQVLGRMATRIASVLRGKHKPVYAPHLDCGDFVIVVNASQVRLTGRKLENKMYYRHSGYMGGLKEVNAARLLETYPDRVIQNAVKGMLPRNPLGRKLLSRLKIHPGAEHTHAAQKPQPLELDA
jgi:large subunit ribosomal protein L13